MNKRNTLRLLLVICVGAFAWLSLASDDPIPSSLAGDWKGDAKIIVSWCHQKNLPVAVTIGTDVTSLCPCSKAISDYGAHNQRSRVRLTTVGRDEDVYPLDVATAFAMIRSVGSSPVFPLIKRPDERVVTMDAHDHPAFVEDMARDLSQACRARGIAHSVSVRNLESIHSHDAVASLTWAPA